MRIDGFPVRSDTWCRESKGLYTGDQNSSREKPEHQRPGYDCIVLWRALLLGYLVFEITSPFLVPLAWSAVLAIFFYPLHENCLKKLRSNPAAVVSAVGVTLLLIVPSLVVLFLTTKQAVEAGPRRRKSCRLRIERCRLTSWMAEKPAAGIHAGRRFSDPVKRGAERLAGYLAAKLGGLVRNLFTFFLDLFVLIFALFFMFRDGEVVARACAISCRSTRDSGRDDARVRELIFASVAVGLLIAAVQGALGGWPSRLPESVRRLFWGVLMAFFSLVPVVARR
jgi:predicted PurR-regulated permease PerM